MHTITVVPPPQLSNTELTKKLWIAHSVYLVCWFQYLEQNNQAGRPADMRHTASSHEPATPKIGWWWSLFLQKEDIILTFPPLSSVFKLIMTCHDNRDSTILCYSPQWARSRIKWEFDMISGSSDYKGAKVYSLYTIFEGLVQCLHCPHHAPSLN